MASTNIVCVLVFCLWLSVAITPIYWYFYFGLILTRLSFVSCINYQTRGLTRLILVYAYVNMATFSLMATSFLREYFDFIYQYFLWATFSKNKKNGIGENKNGSVR